MHQNLIQKILLGILTVTALCSLLFLLYTISEEGRLAEEKENISQKVQVLNISLPTGTNVTKLCEEYAQLSEQMEEKLRSLQKLESTSADFNARKAAAEEELRSLQEQVERFGQEQLDILSTEYDDLLAEYNALNEKYLALLGEVEGRNNE